MDDQIDTTQPTTPFSPAAPVAASERVKRGLRYIPGTTATAGLLPQDYSNELLRAMGIDYQAQKRITKQQPQSFEFDPPYPDGNDHDED